MIKQNLKPKTSPAGLLGLTLALWPIRRRESSYLMFAFVFFSLQNAPFEQALINTTAFLDIMQLVCVSAHQDSAKNDGLLSKFQIPITRGGGNCTRKLAEYSKDTYFCSVKSPVPGQSRPQHRTSDLGVYNSKKELHLLLQDWQCSTRYATSVNWVSWLVYVLFIWPSSS